MVETNEPSELVVDNEPVVQPVVRRVLQAESFRAIEAGEGRQMLHLLDPQVPLDLPVPLATSLHKHQPVRHPR